MPKEVKAEEGDFMGTISTTISLQDKISRTLDNITNRAQAVTRAMEEINRDTERLSNAGVQSLINPSAVNVIYKAQDGIRQFDSIFENLKSKINSVTHPIQSMRSGFEKLKAVFGSVKTTASALKTAFQSVVSTKWNSLKSGISSVKNVLTQGQTGAKGFFNSLKNIGKISVSSTVNGINKLKTGLTSIAGGIVKNAVKGLKSLGAVTLNAAINGLKKMYGLLQKVPGLAAKGTAAFAKWTFKGAAIGLAAGTAAVTALGTAAVKTGMDFEKGMSQVAATMLIDKNDEKNGGAEKYKILENAARACGRSTAFSATEAAEGLNYLALAGYDAEKAAAALPTVLHLAGAGAMELGAASDMVTDSMAALNIEATPDNLTKFSDQLAMTASKANASVSQMGEAVLTVGGTASNLAGGTAELNTCLGLLANAGIKGAEGGTHLRNMLLSLQTPTDDAAALLSEYGVEVYNAQEKMNSMNDIFLALNKNFDKMSDAEIDTALSTIFNKTDLAAARAMINQCGDAYEDLYNNIENSTGACEKMYGIQLDNLNGDISILKSGLSDLGIMFYKDMQAPLRGATQYASSLVNTLSQNYESGGIVGMVSGLGDMFADLIGKGLSLLPNLFNLGTTIITNLLDGISSNTGIIETAIPQIISAIVSGLTTIIPSFIETGRNIILGLITGISSSAGEISSGISEISETFLSALLEIAVSLENAIGDILPTII